MLMSRLVLAAVCSLPAILPNVQAQESPVYTYVAEFTVPRAQWGEFNDYWQKSQVPILERLLADGAIVEYGADATVVHVDGVPTHSFWWSAPTFAGTQRVLAELAKLPANPMIASIKHRDRFLLSIVNRTKAGKISNGYFQLSINYVKPGKGQQWRELYDKYTKPVMEKLLLDGTVLGYGADREYVHTESPAARYEWVLVANAEAVDKIDAAYAADRQKRSAEERRAIGAAFAEVNEAGAHRDGLTRIITWTHK